MTYTYFPDLNDALRQGNTCKSLQRAKTPLSSRKEQVREKSYQATLPRKIGKISMQVKPPPQFLQSPDLVLDDPLIQYVQHAYEDGQIDTDIWQIAHHAEQKIWLNFTRSQESLPEQGWKLHISADLSSAEAVLRNVLPLLLQETAAFKFASSLENLKILNHGEGGKSQIGKFITIYPRNDTEAVALAMKLDQVTQGLSGPRIPSDRMLHANSLIFYRYGGYNGQMYIQELQGLVWPAIRTPDNRLIRDERLTSYHAPENRSDPFLAAGIVADLPQEERLLAQRYMILSVISATVNHTVSLAIDLQKQRTCMIKSSGRIWQNSMPYSASEWARREARILREFTDYARVPTLFDLLDQEHTISLVLEDIRGELLIERFNKLRISGFLPVQQILAWGRDLLDVLDIVHQKGFVYADLKPTNVIIGPDEKLYLIDFEHADYQGSPRNAKQGTLGYMSPQQFAGQPRAFADDIYSFGAMLYLLTTRAEPSNAPDPLELLKRPIELLRPDVPHTLQKIITRCLQPEPEERYSSLREIAEALAAFETDWRNTALSQEHALSGDEASMTSHPQEIARELLHTLCATARKPEKGQGLTWKTSNPYAHNYTLRDLNMGLAGTVLALANLVSEFPDPPACDVLAQSADWLRMVPAHSDPPLPGLYIGEAGVGAALLFAGQVLQDNTLIEAAAERGRQIAALPHISPDIMHGTAGRLLFHLFLWEATAEHEHLAAALACGERLLATTQTREPGEVCWTLPVEFKAFGPNAHPGYAHGAAGIADALLDLFEVTGDERFLPVIQGTARWLQRLAIPVLADKSGLSWASSEEKTEPFQPAWCHGSTGIGQFFLHASRHTWIPHALDTAFGAAQAVVHLGKSSGPTRCHGLAGSIEFLLNMYQETGKPVYLTEAQVFGRMLEAFTARQEGSLVFQSDQPNIFSPDYHIGYAGIAVSFLRLSAPDRIVYQLSRAGFRASKRGVAQRAFSE